VLRFRVLRPVSVMAEVVMKRASVKLGFVLVADEDEVKKKRVEVKRIVRMK